MPAFGAPVYDRIGERYATVRHTDPRIAGRIWAALGGARTVLNVGAGSGSYEPPGRRVVAVEPSIVMLAQRPSGTAPAVRAVAERLPFPDGTFDAANGGAIVITATGWTAVVTPGGCRVLCCSVRHRARPPRSTITSPLHRWRLQLNPVWSWRYRCWMRIACPIPVTVNGIQWGRLGGAVVPIGFGGRCSVLVVIPLRIRFG